MIAATCLSTNHTEKLSRIGDVIAGSTTRAYP
jgi:hypothetical protein